VYWHKVRKRKFSTIAFPPLPPLHPIDKIHANPHSLAYAEIYLTIAFVLRRFELQLFEIGREDVDIARDCFVAKPKLGSKGVRVRVVGERGKSSSD
jgi:hypothetical protein